MESKMMVWSGKVFCDGDGGDGDHDVDRRVGAHSDPLQCSISVVVQLTLTLAYVSNLT